MKKLIKRHLSDQLVKQFDGQLGWQLRRPLEKELNEEVN